MVLTKNPVAEPGAKSFRALVAYILRKFHREFGITDPSALAGQLKIILNKDNISIDIRTLQKILDFDDTAYVPHRHVRDILTRFITKELSAKVKNFSPSWFLARNVEELRRLIEQPIPYDPKRWIAFTFLVPVRPDIMRRLKQDICHHYVSYRYALESGAEEGKIAREVVTFSDEGEKIGFQMTFKFNDTDPAANERVFSGYVLPLGQSLMCVGTYADHVEGGDRNTDLDRGRCLFMHRNVSSEPGKALFGILSTTRTPTGFEACAACVVLFRVEADLSGSELEEFRQKVTVIRPSKEILESDFKDVPKEHLTNLRIFLDNRPRGFPDDPIVPPDHVLKLWHDRFQHQAPSILQYVHERPAAKAPFKAEWREALLADK